MEATELKEERELDIRIKGWRKEEVFEMHFFCSVITQNVSFLCFPEARQSNEETCVERSGNE